MCHIFCKYIDFPVEAAAPHCQQDGAMYFEYKFIHVQSNFSCDCLYPREVSLMNYIQIV